VLFLIVDFCSYCYDSIKLNVLDGLGLVFNVIFNNISVIPWRSVLLAEETGVPTENCHKSLTNFII
jgi:hypothetical protein